MTLSFPSPEFDNAVAAVCHGSATEAEMRALNALLRSDPSARDEYLIRVELHTRLASDPDLLAQPVEAVSGAGVPDFNPGDRCRIASSEPETPRRKKAQGRALVPEATIIGCQRVEGRWPEKQALEFQTVNDRVRLGVPGNFDSLTLLAWVRVKGLDRQFNSLFMCDGFEPGTIHWLIRNDGVLSLTVKGAGPRSFQIMASPPVLTLDKFGMWTHLAVVLDGKAMQLVHYMNGYSVARHKVRLGPPYRLGSAELGNWNARVGPNPTPSLIRNLGASLDEFELFSRALSDAEVLKPFTEGKPEADM
jgi:hypothetical protein